MNRIRFAALLAVAVLAAAPLGAQPFRSDVTGIIPTGSGIAGYPVVPVRDLEGALFRRVEGRTAFRSRTVADAVLGEAAEAQRAACAATLQRPRNWPDSLSLHPSGQRAVCGLLARPGVDTDEARLVLCALRGSNAGTDGDAAQLLVAALAGLAAERPGFVDARQRHTDGARWEAALRAYQAYLSTAPDELMDSPPAVLVAIGVILDRVVDAGLLASER
ncbi:MAG TPA: hypothetical protein VEQ60_05775 [Longimicrobium sp.]|nr:hypothetical protein [Longimicrobium sp.]